MGITIAKSMIHRYIESALLESASAEPRKLVLLLGPRQTGKTTLVRLHTALHYQLERLADHVVLTRGSVNASQVQPLTESYYAHTMLHESIDQGMARVLESLLIQKLARSYHWYQEIFLLSSLCSPKR